MELTRRDAIGALAAAGVVVGGAVVADRWDAVGDSIDDVFAGTDDPEWDEHALETTVAVAQAVYPRQLENIPAFVSTYVLTRSEDDTEYRQRMADAVARLDEYAKHWEDHRFIDLEPDAGEALLHSMGVDVADPDPAGPDPERVRYFLVNELLYALYTTDTGGRLVGLENPQGYPGGTDSYQRGPNRAQALADERTGDVRPGGADRRQDEPCADDVADDEPGEDG